MSLKYQYTTFTKWYTDICGRELSCKTWSFHDAQRLDCEKRILRGERPDGPTRQVPHRGVQEGEGEGRDCRMAPQEPEGTVSSAAPPTLERCVCVQEAAKGGGALAGAKTRGLANECLPKMPPTPDGAHQARSLSCQDRGEAGEARRR